MNVVEYNLCCELFQDLEENKLYQYFLQLQLSSKQKIYDLQQIKDRFYQNEYNSHEVLIFDLNSYFQSIVNAKKTQSILKESALYLLDFIDRKKSKFISYSILEWKEKWCDCYKKVTDLIINSPAEFDIKNVAKILQPPGLQTHISGYEMEKMQKIMENKLNERGRKIITDLILALEPYVKHTGKTIQFDLKQLKIETLLAVRCYLRSNYPYNLVEEANLF